jgi:YfiH family protein
MIPLLKADSLATPHGFFTRQGGVSTGPYASLNCSLSGRDEPSRVAENRARAARALGCEVLVGLAQVHGCEVAVVDQPWPSGAGPAGDAMVTGRAGVGLAIVTADCAPVLLADTDAGVIGAAHAGWRGATAGVLEATVAAMRRLGARIERIAAAVGPCIGQDSYEVGADVRDAALAGLPDAARWFAPGRDPAHWQFDLAGYCVARLLGAGLGTATRIEADTFAEPDRFFSHRRRTLGGGGPIGHQVSIVSLP